MKAPENSVFFYNRCRESFAHTPWTNFPAIFLKLSKPSEVEAIWSGCGGMIRATIYLWNTLWPSWTICGWRADAMSFVVGDGRGDEGERGSEDGIRNGCLSTGVGKSKRVMCWGRGERIKGRTSAGSQSISRKQEMKRRHADGEIGLLKENV